MSEKFPMACYTSSDLAQIYNISTATFRRWVRPLEPQTGPRLGHYYYPRQVNIIVKHLNKRFTMNIDVAKKILAEREKRLQKSKG